MFLLTADTAGSAECLRSLLLLTSAVGTLESTPAALVSLLILLMMCEAENHPDCTAIAVQYEQKKSMTGIKVS